LANHTACIGVRGTVVAISNFCWTNAFRFKHYAFRIVGRPFKPTGIGWRTGADAMPHRSNSEERMLIDLTNRCT
jgi:hypothetical protein